MDKSGPRIDVWVSEKRVDPNTKIDLTEVLKNGALIVVTVPESWPIDGIQELVSRRVCDAFGVDWNCGTLLEER